MELNFKNDIKKWLDEQAELLPIATNFCPNLKPNSEKNLPAKAVIFDIYGTLLISSSGDIDQAAFSEDYMEKALYAGGFNTDYYKSGVFSFLLNQLAVKTASNQKELKLKGHPFPDIDIFKVWDEMLVAAEHEGLLHRSGNESLAETILVFEVLSNKVFPMPGMKETLQKLKEKNIPLGIVSNAQFYTPILMNYFLNGKIDVTQKIEYFEPDLTVFSFNELKAKPDVALFEKFIPSLKGKYGILPQETVFIGNDMLKDVYTAKQAGLQTILFAGDKRSLRLRENDEGVKGLFPDYIITDLKQLLTIVP